MADDKDERVVPRAEWRPMVDVVLDALKEKQFELAWELQKELDTLYPNWLFEIHRSPKRKDTGKVDTPHRAVLAFLLIEFDKQSRKAIGELFGLSHQRVKELYSQGRRRLFGANALGCLEEDYESEDDRRDRRRERQRQMTARQELLERSVSHTIKDRSGFIRRMVHYGGFSTVDED